METGRKSFLDSAPARGIAVVVALAAASVLAYLHRDDLTGAGKKPGVPAAATAETQFKACMAEHGARIDKMVKEAVIQQAMAETFKSRAEGLCRSQAAGQTKAQ